MDSLRDALRTLGSVLTDAAVTPDDEPAAADLDVMLRLCLLQCDSAPAPSHDEEVDALHTALLVAYQHHGGYLAHHAAGVSYRTATLARVLPPPPEATTTGLPTRASTWPPLSWVSGLTVLC